MGLPAGRAERDGLRLSFWESSYTVIKLNQKLDVLLKGIWGQHMDCKGVMWGQCNPSISLGKGSQLVEFLSFLRLRTCDIFPSTGSKLRKDSFDAI